MSAFPCLDVKRSEPLTAESGVPTRAPKATPLHRCCKDPVRVSQDCYDKIRLGQRRERVHKTSPIHFLYFWRPYVQSQGVGMAVLPCRLQGRILLASFSFWKLLASLGLCPHHSSLCLVFMRTSLCLYLFFRLF